MKKLGKMSPRHTGAIQDFLAFAGRPKALTIAGIWA